MIPDTCKHPFVRHLCALLCDRCILDVCDRCSTGFASSEAMRISHLHVHYSGGNKGYVSGSSKIQTLCHLTQVLLKLRFTVMETLTGY